MDTTGEERTKLLDENEKPAAKVRWNLLSKWTYWWIVGTIRKGYSGSLSNRDVHAIIPQFAAGNLEERIESKRRAGGGKKSSIQVALPIFRAFPMEIAEILLMFLLMECFRLAQPYVLGLFLEYISSGTVPDNVGYTYAGLLVLTAFGFLCLNMHSFYMGEMLGSCLKAAYGSTLYSKILKMRLTQHQQITSGYIINLFGTDMECLCAGVSFTAAGVSSVFNTAVVIALLYDLLGWCSLIGVALSGISLIPSTIFATLYGRMRSAIAESSDCRVQVMNEIISAIQVIKMYCWEETFENYIAKRRGKEMRCVAKGNVYYCLSYGFASAPGVAATAAMLITYHAVGHELTVSKVFMTMLYCQMLRFVALLQIPEAVKRSTQIIRSLKRVEAFLREVDEHLFATAAGQEETEGSESKVAVQLDRVTASWDRANKSTDRVCQLKDITLACGQGSLTAVVGPVGAGKTSLLMYLAGEMPHQSGQLTRNGDISYCPQDSWIFQDTVQQNILFGQNMESDRYTKVVEVCGLVEDLANMPRGDLTEVGARGLTLSGGQKARVSLARALYREADIYLLDDPLSAVDSKVGGHMFQRAIKEFLAGKTRILVTHQTQYLPDVDQIVVLRQGCASYVRSLNEIPELSVCQSAENESQQEQSLLDTSEDLPQVTSKDTNVQGDVSWTVYFGLVRAGGAAFFLAGLLLHTFTLGVVTAAAWYLSEWTNEQEQSKMNQTLSTSSEDERLLDIYTGLTCAGTLLSMVSLVPMALFLAKASENLHNSMFHRVMRAPMRFFDITPIGIVINKFSRDLGFVDLLLPPTFFNFLVEALSVLGQILVICVVLPWLLIAMGVLSVILYALYRFCKKAFRDLKRLEASARSPVFSHLSETLVGLQNIRIFKKEHQFKMRFDEYQDHSTMCWLMFLTCSRWLAMILSLAVVGFLALTVTMVVLLKDEVSPALLGLCLTYVLNSLETFEYSFRLMAQMENCMMSVERILHYAQLEQEAAPITDYRPSSSWPEAGRIQFQDVSLYYNEGATPALKNISFVARPQEKIAIVGRTGSGKSSLLRALMRLTEPQGRIFIDDVNIMEIGVRDLREQISVIPQDPVLINGTVRQNLDPVGNPTDDDYWQALRKVQLSEKIAAMEGGLDAEIYQGGSNLSVGQRQLVCLARALLRGNKILVLDEATANIDRFNDQMIQVAIRAYFRHCTIFIIAHRLETIMDCNSVMVLEEGCLKEYGNPYLLLKSDDSLLGNYARRLGEGGFKSCLEIAKEAYINRLSPHL